MWGHLPDGVRALLERDLSPTDLQTLLLSVAAARAEAVTPARVLRRWREDRFVRPSTTDPRALASLEARLWDLLPPTVDGVELSPVAPLGTCSVVSGTGQHRQVTTVRGTEVVGDPTNALAVEAAARRARQDRSGRVDLACCHRVLRGQGFDGPGLFAHFRLFCLVTSTRDIGSGRASAGMLVDHLRFWTRVLAELLPDAEARIAVSVFDAPVLAERLRDTILPAVGTPAGSGSGVVVVEDPDRVHGRGYYTGAAVSIDVRDGDGWQNLGDGGLTTWTAQLTGDRKELCLTSCVSTERLLALSGRSAARPVR
ncbi:MAG: hypothetical protein GXX79_17070 [Actinomycetales bacterium]|nr:hypothetical protein [Actinomycetales bacterium]